MTAACVISAGTFAEQFLVALRRPDSNGSRLRVLDVGTGTARIPIEILTRDCGIEMIGVDIRPFVLQRALRDIAGARIERGIDVHRADACALPYPDQAFDAVISNSLIHHLPRPIDALREMIRVLRPGGLLFVRDSLRQSDADQIVRTLTRAATTADRRRSDSQEMLPTALTLEAARALARASGLPPESVRRSGPRHWLIRAARSDIPEAPSK